MALRVSASALVRASRPLLQTPTKPANTSAGARRPIVASPQTPSAAKAQTVVETTRALKQTSFTERAFTTKNLCILGIGAGVVATAASFAALTAKVGALGASQLIATHAVAFLQPGLVVTAFALKAGATVTMSAAMPVILPIASTVLVGGLGVVLIVFLAKKTFSGAGMVKDAVLALPKKLIEQLPGGKAMVSYFSSEGKTPTEKELLIQHQAMRERAVEENREQVIRLAQIPGLEVADVTKDELSKEKKAITEEKKENARRFKERGIITRARNLDLPFEVVATHQPGEMATRARTKESLELSAKAAKVAEEPTSGSSAKNALAFLASAVVGATAIGFALKTGAEFGDAIGEL